MLKVETVELEFSMEGCEDSNTDGWGTLFGIFSGSQNYHQSSSNSESLQLNLSGQGSSHLTPVPSLPRAFHHTERVFRAPSVSPLVFLHPTSNLSVNPVHFIFQTHPESNQFLPLLPLPP